VLKCEQGAGGKPGEKPGFPHPIAAIEFGVAVLLVIDFNDVEFLCVIFWVHSD